jgi:hypothetical protein
MNANVYVITGWRKEEWTNRNPNAKRVMLKESLKSDILFTRVHDIII